MPLPARNSLAVIGAGPIGLEAACAGLDRGFDVHLFERGEVGSHPIAWGHVRLFTPWRMNVGAASRRRLEATGWSAPDPETYPTGEEYAERYLALVARLPELAGRVHTHSQVVHIGRRGLLKGDDLPAAKRREAPFRLLVRDQGGRENFLNAFAVIDASGVYGQSNWAGDGGIPARGELYLAPQLSYHIDDVRGLSRARYAGRRSLVIGAGASAATVLSELAALANEVPGTAAVWATRKSADALYPMNANDPLPARRTLYERARDFARGTHPAIAHVGGVVVEGFEFNSATHRYRVTLRPVGEGGADERSRVEEVDQVVVNTGFGPDNSIYRELRIHECYGSRGPMALSAALQGANAADCLTTPRFGADVLANPEPDFFILGNKSYARYNNFLIETGFAQVKDVIEKLAVDRQVMAGV